MSKLSDCESEAAETQVWIEFAVRCGYLAGEDGNKLYGDYDRLIGALVSMIAHPESWILLDKGSRIQESAAHYRVPFG